MKLILMSIKIDNNNNNNNNKPSFSNSHDAVAIAKHACSSIMGFIILSIPTSLCL